MSWAEFIVHTTSFGADDVSALLMEAGAVGTQTEDRADIPDPSKPHGYWEIIDPGLIESMPEDVLVHGWFESGSSFLYKKERILLQLSELREKASDYGTLAVDIREIPDENWAETWKQSYHAFRAGQHLVIKPSWEEYTPEDGDHIIEMDPGMAFGSGYHDTTRLCLTLLEKYLQPGQRVIDLGTGSGILALGAAFSGAGSVLAIDIDSDAVRVARENVAHHGLSRKIQVQEGDLLSKVSEICDLCVANIIADIIISSALQLKDHIVPGGLLICSGIILERTEEVRSALLSAGYEFLEQLSTEEWTAFCVRRPL